MEFQLIAEDKNTKARAGKLITDHGEIETPIFMPVGTIGTVKGVTQENLLNDIQAQIILGNTNHLYKISLPLLMVLLALFTRRLVKSNSK